MLEYRTIMTQRKYLDLVQELEALRRRASADGLVEWEGRGPGPTRPGRALDGFEAQERVRELEERIRSAEVVVPSHRDKVFFGSTVSVRDLDRNASMEYTLAGPTEVDPARGRISSASPIGRALLGKSVGDAVTVEVPRGVLRLEVRGFR